MAHALDNPIWNALTTEQAHLSVGDGRARVFQPEISVLAGVRERSAEAWHSLAGLAGQGTLGNFMVAEPGAAPGFEQVLSTPLLQMVQTGEAPATSNPAKILTMSAADVPEMAALVELTKPGPFSARTIEMGTYLGIRESGRLAAMAGERLHLPGYVEVSAVCTHPESAGKGYAAALMSTLIAGIRSRGETPFLHVRPDNARAIALYRRLGFSDRKFLHLLVVRRQEASGTASPTA
ncbi:MAG TPA: GNAT family N-acetyltransferase [Terriglobales bacterium]|nr:GNAT family N-acetyltransferase [Terriglobales bacterium]